MSDDINVLTGFWIAIVVALSIAGGFVIWWVQQ